MRWFGWCLLGWLSLGGLAHGESDEALTLRTQLLEALRAERYAEVQEAFRGLRELSPVDDRLCVAYAQACYQLGDMEPADSALSEVLRRQPDHVEGLGLLALVSARSGDLPRAQALLLHAARSGRAVLNDLSGGEGKRVLGGLLSDPQFVLAVMVAGQGFEVKTIARNPFRSSLVLLGEVQDPPPPVRKRPNALEALEREIDAAFESIAQLYRDDRVDDLQEALGRVRELLTRFEAELGDEGLDAAQARLEHWTSTYADLEELYQSILLQLHVRRGNSILRGMHSALDADDYEAVAVGMRRMEDLAEVMAAQPRTVFERNAQALLIRARSLAERALILRRIASLDLAVTGIVLPGPNEPARAIVNDRIHEEGDLVLTGGPDQAVYEDVRVLSIRESRVRFRCAGVEFVRALMPLR